MNFGESFNFDKSSATAWGNPFQNVFRGLHRAIAALRSTNQNPNDLGCRELHRLFELADQSRASAFRSSGISWSKAAASVTAFEMRGSRNILNRHHTL